MLIDCGGLCGPLCWSCVLVRAPPCVFEQYRTRLRYDRLGPYFAVLVAASGRQELGYRIYYTGYVV